MDYKGSGDVYIPYALYTYKVLDRLQEELKIWLRFGKDHHVYIWMYNAVYTLQTHLHALYILLYIHRKPSHTENTQLKHTINTSLTTKKESSPAVLNGECSEGCDSSRGLASESLIECLRRRLSDGMSSLDTWMDRGSTSTPYIHSMHVHVVPYSGLHREVWVGGGGANWGRLRW